MTDRPLTNLPTAQDSALISALRIMMIVGLVFHHLFAIPNSGYFPRQGLTLETLNLANVLNGVLHWSTMAAVPILSIISGYLYFSRPKVDHSLMLKKRVKSVLLPSLAWTSFWLFFGYIVAKAGRAFNLFQWLDYGLLAEPFSWLTLLNGIIGITEFPLAYQFWFIHDLVLTLLLAPAIGWFANRTGWAFILALTIIWLFDAVPFPFFYSNVLYFFCLGVFITAQRQSLSSLAEAGQRWSKLLLGLFCFLLATRLAQDLHPLFGSYFWLCLLRLTGVAALGLYVHRYLKRPNTWVHRVSAYSPYAFFIFATHYPLIDFYKILFEYLPGQASAPGQILSLFLIPSFTVFTCLVGAKLFARVAPGTFAFLNGGRAIHANQRNDRLRTDHCDPRRPSPSSNNRRP